MATKLAFNTSKAKEVFRILDAAWKNRSGIFKNAILPEDRWPAPEDPKEHANWLFYAALPMRGGLVSESPFKWLFKLREIFPGLFEPETVAEKWTPERIKIAFAEASKEILSGNGTGEPERAGVLAYKGEEYSRAWHENSLVLVRYWGGDLRNVFWGVTEFEEAFRRIDHKKNPAGFKGMRRKIFSLLTIWLQNRELIPIFPTPIPVDFHALRVLWATGVLEIKSDFSPNGNHPTQLKGKQVVRIYEGFVDAVAKWSQTFIIQNEFSHRNLNPALWFLSRILCAGHIQNSSKNGEEFVAAEDLAEDGIMRWPRAYQDPCAHCPVERFCEWAIPSMPYYRWGLLVRIGKRVDYPVLNLPLGNEFLPAYKARKK